MRNILQRLYRGQYNGRVKRIIQTIGINKYLSSWFWNAAYLLSGETETHEIGDNTVKFHTESFSEFMRFQNLANEEEIIERFVKDINPDDVVFDIGANVGTYTCASAQRIQAGSVVAFEPHPANVSRLSENLRVNSLKAPILQIALSNRNGVVDLGVKGSEAGAGEHTISPQDNQLDTIPVFATKGDTLISEMEVPSPTVIKIDVEGAEFLVLKGIESAIENSCRVIYCEVHPHKLDNFGSDESEIIPFLESQGFSVEVLADRGTEYFIRAEKI